MMTNTQEAMFVEDIVWRVECIRKLTTQESVAAMCDTMLEYIAQQRYMVEQKDNYEQLLLDRMFAAGYINKDAYKRYSPSV
ncbi:MAG: hypothetical protein IM613_12510 [Cytophagales bacterium]|jgi:hypothetical protein|nr:hypothetical protein [Cytophagales bacterium]